MKQISRILLFSLGLGVCMLGGCGYHLVNAEQDLPQDVDSIGIPLLKNATIEAGLEDIITQEIRRQFLENSSATVLDSDQADAVLLGTITEIKTSAETYSKGGKVNMARVQINADFKLVHSGSGELIWSSGGLSASEEYPVTSETLQNEHMRALALEQIAEDLSETVSQMLLADF